MAALAQKLVPGIVGISTYVDFAYQKEMQLAATAAAGTEGPINQLRTVTATLDFNLLVRNLRTGNREAAEEQVAVAVQSLAGAGANFVVVTSGTTSTLLARARQSVSLPFLDLAAACFKPSAPSSPVGLLSTSYAASGGIFQHAAALYGATILVPPVKTAERVDRAIFDELIRGKVSAANMSIFRAAIDELVAAGARSIILGNTDLTLIGDELQTSAGVPLIDSARAHAREAARAALSGEL